MWIVLYVQQIACDIDSPVWLYHSYRKPGVDMALVATVQLGTAQEACPMRVAVDWLIELVRKEKAFWIMYAVDSDMRHYCTAVTERKLVGVTGNWWAFACTVIMVLKQNKNRLYLWWNGSNRNLFTFSDENLTSVWPCKTYLLTGLIQVSMIVWSLDVAQVPLSV